MYQTIKPHLPQLFKFLVSGGTATLVHLGTFYLLSSVVGMWYGSATTIGFLLGFVVSFTLQKYWTFQESSKKGVHKQAGLFFVLQIGNLALNFLLMVVLVGGMGIPELIAQVCVLGFLAGCTFVTSKLFIFRP